MEWTRGETIGHGSFGSVNLAIPRNGFSPLMAVKSCSVLHSASLQNEKRVLNQLSNCSNVIKCFGEEYTVEKNGEKLYNLLLEFASKGSLSDRLKQSNSTGLLGLPQFEIRRYTNDILKGLIYIHSNGYAHCDIKLQNLLIKYVDEFDVIKIADFGLARKANCTTARTGFLGTPLNMSPESVTAGEYEAPADIWALGCVIVEMASGTNGWNMKTNRDLNALLFRIGIGDEIPQIPAGFCEDGKDFLRKCFVKDPRRRWTAQMLMNHPFIATDNFNAPYHNVDYIYSNDVYSLSPTSPFDYHRWISISNLSPDSKALFDGEVELPFGSWSTCHQNVPDSPSSVFVVLETETVIDRELKLSSESSLICPSSSPENRMRQLVTEELPNWSVSETWVTIR